VPQLDDDSFRVHRTAFGELTYDPPPSDFSGFRFTATLTVNEAVLFAV